MLLLIFLLPVRDGFVCSTGGTRHVLNYKTQYREKTTCNTRSLDVPA